MPVYLAPFTSYKVDYS